MSSEIEWLRSSDGTKGESWNPITGCSPASSGCLHCYAAALAGRHMCDDHKELTRTVKRRNERGKLVKLAVFNGTIHLHPDRLTAPVGMRKGKRIFVNSMSDLFHEGVPFKYIAAVYGVMTVAEQHTFLVLTKRAWRAPQFFAWLHEGPGLHHRINDAVRKYVPGWDGRAVFPTQKHGMVPDRHWPPRNVQLGFSAEDQSNWDSRIADFSDVEAYVRWVSIEPQLGPIDMCRTTSNPGIQWVVVGGESGPGSRPFDVDWATSLVAQCDRLSIPVFIKQLGTKPIREAKPLLLESSKGCDLTEWTGPLKHLHRRELALGGLLGTGE